MNALVLPFPAEKLATNIAAGQMEIYHPTEVPKEIDCGDERTLTEACAAQRQDIPARIFGAAVGLTEIALVSTIMQSTTGKEQVEEWLGEYENGLAELVSSIANIAFKKEGIYLHVHSSDITEGNQQHVIDEHPHGEDLDCAYKKKHGLVIGGSGTQDSRDILRVVTDEFMIDTDAADIDHAIQSTLVLHEVLGGNTAKISRAQYMREVRKSRVKTPLTLVRGHHAPADQSTATLDLLGVKAKANGTDFHQTTVLAERFFKDVMPELGLEAKTQRLAGLVSGVAATQVLGVQNLHVLTEQTASGLYLPDRFAA